MKRLASAMVLVAGLSGCVSVDKGGGAGPGAPGGPGCYGGGGTPPMVPGMQAAWGQPVPMAAPYAVNPPGAEAARAMLQRSVPLDMIQASHSSMSGSGSGLLQTQGAGGNTMPTMAPQGGLLSPPNMPFGPGMPPPGSGQVAAIGAMPMAPTSRFPTQRTSVRFVRPTGMKISWFAPTADGKAGFTSTQLDAPGRYNFAQAAIYRLKLSGIEGHSGLVVYPTLEVVPSNSKTDSFLAHSAVPIEFTNEDFEQVKAGNYLVKVIYLPDPQFQDVAASGGLEEIVSSRLEPGTDPINEAQRRGSILLVIRMGNILLELDNTPAMDAPNPYLKQPTMPNPGPGLGMMGPGGMVPPGLMGPGGLPVDPRMLTSPPMGPGGPMIPPGLMGPGIGAPLLPPNGLPPVTKASPISRLPDESEIKQVGYKK